MDRVLVSASRRDSSLLAGTLDRLADLGPLPDDIRVHLAPPGQAASHITLHLPEGWDREHEWMNLFTAACAPPAAAA
jgi:hypothetical protein